MRSKPMRALRIQLFDRDKMANHIRSNHALFT